MPEPILCPECGHDIDSHGGHGIGGRSCMVYTDEGYPGCDCRRKVSDIAHAYGEERFNDGWDACELRWAVRCSE